MFSRDTIIEGIAILQERTHAEINRILLYLGLEDISPDNGNAKFVRVNEISIYLIKNQNDVGPRGDNIIIETFERILDFCKERGIDIQDNYQKFINSLIMDGFRLDDYCIIKLLPDEIELPKKKYELELLLEKHSFNTTKGHFDQALSAHTRGNWASANAQMRTYIESLFDEIANKLKKNGDTLPSTSYQKRESLAKLDPPFIYPGFNEWEIDGKGGFIQGFFKRLHPTGSHPGLSDDTDSTFRLHLIIIVSHHFLKRLDSRI